MRKQNLIIYESFMEIFNEFVADQDYELACEYMQAIFNYYRTGEEYCGKNREIRLLLKDVYPLVVKQAENYLNKVEEVISNEEFTTLATSGNFPTQTKLAEYISQHYGPYTQPAVSKRLKSLGLQLVKTPNKTTTISNNTAHNSELTAVERIKMLSEQNGW